MHGNDRSWNSVVDFIPDATLVINQNGKVIAWNRAMEKLTGVRAKNILGKGNYEYAIPFYGKRRPILIDVALNPDCIESVQTHYAILTTDGVFHSAESYTPGLKKNPDTHLSATASLLRDTDGYIIGAIECMRDDTGRKRLEKALVHSEKQYRELVDNSPVGIYRTTLAGKILYANQAMVDILAYNSPDELINLKSFIFYENVRDRRKLITRLRKDGKLNNYPIELITKTGAIRHVIVSASREQGVISGIIVDITQQKLAVEENQKLQAQLMRAQKMEALGTLAGGIDRKSVV